MPTRLSRQRLQGAGDFWQRTITAGDRYWQRTKRSATKTGGWALARLDGNGTLLQEMAVPFCEEGSRLMTGIREAIAQGETAELRRIAHTLKGSADMFAAQPAVEDALRLETLARDGDLTHVEDACLALEDTMARLLPIMRDVAKIDGT